MPAVLFVCTGNLCRSPMAVTLLRARLAQDPERRTWQVLSAGTWAADGLPASPEAEVAMAERGLAIGDHRSRRVTEELLDEADVVLGMTPHHVEALRLAFPRAAGRIHLLADMCGEWRGVVDPYGLSLAEYRATAAELARLIDAGYERIVALAER
jgi:protein-tyrosine phosphatase